jgi:lysine 6-dehydrogenase
MRFLVLGAGLMGRAVAFDLSRSESVEHIRVLDIDERKAVEVKEFLDSPKVGIARLDVADHGRLVEVMADCDVAVSCIPYRFNYELATAAVEAGCGFCDLGGNTDIVQRELSLDEDAKSAGVTVIPDCGLAPGLSSILAADAMKRFDRMEELHIRVGGLPVNPRPPLDYMMVFSPVGLINEYKEKCIVIKDGEVRTVEPLEDLEELEFPEPFGKLEAFTTSGGTSTLPQTLLGKVDALDCKTIRYRGHCEKIKLLRDLGFFDETPVLVDGREVVPRDITEALLVSMLSFGEDDVVLLRVWATGVQEGRERTVTYTMVDHCDRANGLTAMMRTTAYPASILAQMIASGEIAQKGALPQELVVPTERFLEELKEREVDIEVEWD